MRFLKRPKGAPSAGGVARPRGIDDGRTRPIEDDPDWRAFDSVAEAYARSQAPRMAMPAADLVSEAGIAPGWRVLDVGTGTGVAARAAAEVTGPEGVVVGVDVSMPMLAFAIRDRGGPRYAAAQAIDLPFRDQAFDAVLCSFVLPFFRRYDTALFDMLRVLRPGGVLGVTAWGPAEDEFQRAWRDVTWEFAEREMLADSVARAVPWEERFSDPIRLKDTLHEAGLRDMVVDRREYRYQMTRGDYLESRESSVTGRFLRQMLGEELWQRLRARAREVFAERFPERFNDFRDVIVVVGRKP
jgi:ubiquinone/menaquinone biosynthesis C-methylase UbiE